jgi:hypothetical protein
LYFFFMNPRPPAKPRPVIVNRAVVKPVVRPAVCRVSPVSQPKAQQQTVLERLAALEQRVETLEMVLDFKKDIAAARADVERQEKESRQETQAGHYPSSGIPRIEVA